MLYASILYFHIHGQSKLNRKRYEPKSLFVRVVSVLIEHQQFRLPCRGFSPEEVFRLVHDGHETFTLV